ncbi:hypothetical protein [Kitasatospora cinereorecta]|uniref:Uncharacterized protein n=1 Tax=Kitasatospora cinereorecta TaxID=285560 RepID=A0ABW0VM29_9ACTN
MTTAARCAPCSRSGPRPTPKPGTRADVTCGPGAPDSRQAEVPQVVLFAEAL